MMSFFLLIAASLALLLTRKPKINPCLVCALWMVYGEPSMFSYRETQIVRLIQCLSQSFTQNSFGCVVHQGSLQ